MCFAVPSSVIRVVNKLSKKLDSTFRSISNDHFA